MESSNRIWLCEIICAPNPADKWPSPEMMRLFRNDRFHSLEWSGGREEDK